MPKVRTTISIDESVLDDWRHIASLQRTSFSSLVNEWLEDLSETARYKALQIHQDGSNKRLRIMEMTTALAVLQEGYQAAMKETKGGGFDRALAQRVPPPPSSNTGGKGPKPAAKGRAS